MARHLHLHRSTHYIWRLFLLTSLRKFPKPFDWDAIDLIIDALLVAVATSSKLSFEKKKQRKKPIAVDTVNKWPEIQIIYVAKIKKEKKSQQNILQIK